MTGRGSNDGGTIASANAATLPIVKREREHRSPPMARRRSPRALLLDQIILLLTQKHFTRQLPDDAAQCKDEQTALHFVSGQAGTGDQCVDIDRFLGDK